MTHQLFATAPPGAEDLLCAELEALGVTTARARKGGVGFRAPLALAYRVCLWSRVAGRVLLELAELPARTGDELYEAARALDWTAHLERGSSFAISASGRPSPTGDIDNTHFAALRVKDGLVDQLRTCWGERPDVELDEPDLRLRLHLNGERATLSLDLSGGSLHRRGYRVETVTAPLREDLAAAVLLRAGAAGRAVILDPMCGSGTLLIEAAWLAADVAPGLLRERWGFEGWRGHAAEPWAELLAEAHARRTAGLAGPLPSLIGYDVDAGAIRAALACIEAAGLHGKIHVERRSLAELEAPSLPGPDASELEAPTLPGPEPSELEAPTLSSPGANGLVVCNPPWGERIAARERRSSSPPSASDRRELESLYAALGRRLREGFVGWDAAILTGDPSLGLSLGIRAYKRNALHDGPIACQILRLRITEAVVREEAAREPRPPARERSEGARSFANRLVKNRKQLRAWLRREDVSCYRLYDADIPEYNFAVDLYTDVERDLVHAHVQEYAAPKEIPEADARRRRGEALAVVRELLELPRERVHLKRRSRQKGNSQYQKLDDAGREFVVAEGPARLWVNLDDYLDTGLFLDHRPLRTAVREAAAGERVLNLFCYTASVSVHAALGGATSTTSVDLSRTYLDWAARNFALNGLRCTDPDEPPHHNRRSRTAHELVRDDVLGWLHEQGARRWGLIVCDPPSFSNSKRMEGVLDVQRDHVELIHRCVALLRPGGQLWFSTNLRKFELDAEGLAGLNVEAWHKSVPPDFSRKARIHHSWVIRR